MEAEGPSRRSRESLAVLFSTLALLSFMARTFIDYGFVYEELNLTGSSLGLITLFNVALLGGWVWALIAASHRSRRAMWALLAYDLLLVLFGLSTLISFCPSPCQTAWPLGEIVIWSNLTIGIPAVVLTARNLFADRI